MSTQNKDMNCNDYRQAVTGDPQADSAALREHAAECADCRAFGNSMTALDARLRRAMEIPVPDMAMPELAEVGDADNVVSLPPRRLRAPAWLAIAAGVALAAFIGMSLWTPGAPQQSLAEEIVAHIDHEPGSLVVTNVAVPEQTVQSTVSGTAAMDPGIGLITYATNCPIRGNIIPHLVIKGEKGPVTILLLPEEKIDGAIPIHGKNLNGVILPVGNGSVAIVGEQDEQIEKIGNRVVDSVKWST